MIEGLESTIFQVKEEMDKIYCSLISGELTREQYLELYSAQQALSWVLGSGASPYNTIMAGKVWPPESKIFQTMDIQVN